MKHTDWSMDRVVAWLTFGALLLFLLAMAVATTGCQMYGERFTYVTPEGVTNHTVHVTYRSFMMFGEAGEFASTTQTQEFIREVNGKNMKSRPDPDAVKAITEGVSSAVIKAIAPTP